MASNDDKTNERVFNPKVGAKAFHFDFSFDKPIIGSMTVPGKDANDALERLKNLAEASKAGELTITNDPIQVGYHIEFSRTEPEIGMITIPAETLEEAEEVLMKMVEHNKMQNFKIARKSDIDDVPSLRKVVDAYTQRVLDLDEQASQVAVEPTVN